MFENRFIVLSFLIEQDNRFIYQELTEAFIFQVAEFTVDNIMFAVKTYSKFHRDRIPVIQKTWAKDIKHIRYFSDVFGNYGTCFAIL